MHEYIDRMTGRLHSGDLSLLTNPKNSFPDTRFSMDSSFFESDFGDNKLELIGGDLISFWY